MKKTILIATACLTLLLLISPIVSFAKDKNTILLPDYLKLSNEDGEIVKDPSVIAGRIVRAIAGLSGSVALLLFVYGGALWVLSQGKEDQIKKGRDYMIWSFIGITFILSSFIIVLYIMDILVDF